MQYISAAENFAAGDGLRAHWWEEGDQPLTHFPPAFPITLAALGEIGLSALDASRALNITALLLTALLTFGLARKAANGSTVAAFLAVGALVLARDVLEAHAMVWSEPLFLVLVLAVLYLTVLVIEHGGRTLLFTAGLLAGLAGLTRYAVPPLTVTCAMALLLLGAVPRRERLARAATFLVIATVPLVLLFGFNASRGESATNRELGFHPPGMDELENAARTAYQWVVPTTAPDALKMLFILVIGFATVTWLLAIARSPARIRTQRSAVRVVLALFATCYAGFLVAILTLVDAQSTPGPRLLLPLLPVVTILAVALLRDSMDIARQRPSAIVLSTTLSAGLLLATGSWVIDVREKGLGYNAPVWEQSPIIAELRTYDDRTLIYTNHPAAVLFQTGREVLGIPRVANPNSRKTDSTFASRIGAACLAASERTVVYAHFTRESEWFLPPLSVVRAHWRSTPKLIAADGVLDVVPATCAARATESAGAPGNDYSQR